MKTFVGLTLVAIITISAINIFSVDDALAHMIVLGRVPGTETQLGLGAIVGLIILCLPMISVWIRNFNDQLIDSKLASANRDAVKQYENQIAEVKQQNAQQIARQLDIDELDVISL